MMLWWRTEEKGVEAVGLGDEEFEFGVSRKGNLIELTVVEREEAEIVYYAVWNRREKKFEVGGEHV